MEPETLNGTIPIDPAPPVIKPKRNLTLPLVIGGVILFLILVTLFLVIGLSQLNRPPAPKVEKKTPLETKTVELPPVVNSKFASDSGLLQLKTDLKDAASKIDSVDLFETQISPPNIDLNIKI